MKPIETIESKEKLLQTAIRLVWQSHYDKVGVNEICQQAGVTKGCFYHHFPSKAELFSEASEYYWESAKPILDEIFSPSKTAREQLEAVIEHTLEKQTKWSDGKELAGCPFFTSGAQGCASDSKVKEAVQRMCHRAERYYTVLIRNLQQEGEMDIAVNAENLARILLQFMQGAMLYGQIHGNIEQMREDVRAGLYRILGLSDTA